MLCYFTYESILLYIPYLRTRRGGEGKLYSCKIPHCVTYIARIRLYGVL